MKSMTGYAALDRDGRRWELRSVNARGLDLRLRLPEVAGLEPAARAALGAVAARGGVTLSLRLGGEAAGAAPRLDLAGLDRALDALSQVAARATQPLAPVSAAQILGLRGVWEAGEADPPPLDALVAALGELTTAFAADRAREGAALRAVLAEQVDEIAALTDRARALGAARADHMAEAFRAALARVAEAGLDERRVATEIAALAVKADIAEELDRLDAHVAAARALLDETKPAGRRLDFLTQEFNREANTLCSKAQMTEMTEIGLALKAVIDRLREQVQNVE
ncbi:YicC/YloC family endoribonuclease [Jannaschia ovalis]|uniref:YicC family protein n=1 Tax=Jannaschia ovalis TaxID=3038773 RepID=A0ABY8LBY0_9RHOB|nr:YicC/YloC family endoribonuclease [Jannaschia sp. GRR-S6-38]WGH78799.1 YicC family protein [Jannaschia sp. GRR-S6-38]